MEHKSERKIKYGVQLKFVGLFFAFIAALLIFLNTYPLLATRDLVFSTKQSSLQSQAAVVSSSLGALGTLSSDSVQQVMELLDVSGLTRVIVTDAYGKILYDNADTSADLGKYALFSEINLALEGNAVCWTSFSDGAFSIRAAAPVRSWGSTVGAVYLYDHDPDQGALLLQLQRTLRGISLVVGCLALLLMFAFARALTQRITELVRAIRVVRDGAYDFRLKTRGHDEITELGEAFNSMTAQLQETEELRRRFVSDASHELKTPLASIRLLSDSIAQSGNMDMETMREFVTDIGSEAERLQRTTEKLLRLTRLDAAPRETPKDRVDVARVAEDTLRLLLPLAEERSVKLCPELQEGCCILGSGDDLYQIIFNLVENGIKYNVPGGQVRLIVRREWEEIAILVEDTGIGIPEEDLPHIFSRFYRVDKARSREAGGSGLGLSIVRDAVALYGGTIRVERRKEGGTRFTVRFPRAGEEAQS